MGSPLVEENESRVRRPESQTQALNHKGLLVGGRCQGDKRKLGPRVKKKKNKERQKKTIDEKATSGPQGGEPSIGGAAKGHSGKATEIQCRLTFKQRMKAGKPFRED